jgi:hypothetical protein
VLVEIEKMTEEQVKAFVAGPLTRETGVPCRFEMEIEYGRCVAYIFIGEDDMVGWSRRGNPPGDQSQQARDTAAARTVSDVVDDTGFAAVWAVYLD